MSHRASRPPPPLPIGGRVESQGHLEHLPEPLTALFGRDEDLARLRSLWAGGARLVTLTGPPGIGKTRLALATANQWIDGTGHDARFVPLAAINDPQLVLDTIAHSLSVEASRRSALLDRIVAAVQGRRMLLVLDNFEQVTAAGADVVELLTRAPLLLVLVTSRALLRVRGEYEWPVRPLDLPPQSTAMSASTLEKSPAVALLLDRARAANPELKLNESDAGAMAAICGRLEGIPLAIELAAPWLRLFTPESLLQRLEQRLALLRGGARDLPPRQQALVDAIAWSDNLLTAAERGLFHHLAVFVDGWTLEAAEAVCHPDQPADAVLERLAGLLDKSLIYRAGDPAGPPRFGMLEMIREYASEQLAQEDDVDATRQRHADYFTRFAEGARPQLYRSDQPAWLERLERELGNLRGALHWLIAGGQRANALRLAADLENFWLVHDHLEEGHRWLTAAMRTPGAAAPEIEADARRALAALDLRRGDYAQARALYTANLVFARERGDRAMIAQTLLDLGTLRFISDDLAHAANHFEEAVALGRASGDRRTVARALNQLGELARFAGDDSQAAARYEASLALWRELAELERVAMVLHNLGPVVARLGDRARANALLGESLSLSWELRNRHGAAICLVGIAGASGTSWTEATAAAQLLGAADTFRASIGVQWEPVDQAEYERSVATVRSRLDETAFAEAFRQGRFLTLATAVELAQRTLSVAADRGSPPGAERQTGRRPGGLTRREYEIAQHVALGQTNREIAAQLFIAEKTVEMHVSHSLEKLGLRSRAQLAAWMAARTDRGT